MNTKKDGTLNSVPRTNNLKSSWRILTSTSPQGRCYLSMIGTTTFKHDAYIHMVHPNDNQSWHIVLDSIMFDTTKGLVEVVNTIANLNKWILRSRIWKFYIVLFVTCTHFYLFICQSPQSLIMPSLVHDLFRIQSIKKIPLKQLKDVLPANVYEKVR